MSEKQIHAVTGAYGYSGKYISGRLLDKGRTVITLTNSPRRANPFGGRVPARAFNFDQPELLTQSLRGVTVLYNTYWVRFNHKLFNFDPRRHGYFHYTVLPHFYDTDSTSSLLPEITTGVRNDERIPRRRTKS